ncbi:glycosyltransferase [uncultured Paracoccus sp.]|uniref:glycosyltransferase n=1 Tax=uncultured Paracoccus sp. TaxID=189685 RepID=UPI0025FF4C38|nr:glycosyltransferase [uncultured Paracoccus sp.]
MTAPHHVRVGYVVKRYPRFSETFIVNEILAHEEAGRQIDIFALRAVEESHFQDILSRVRAAVTRVPDRFRGPDELWQLMLAGQGLPGLPELAARFPEAQGRDIAQALVIALAVRERGIDHLHAHFGTIAATVARIAAALAGVGWSVTLHAKDIYCQYEENQHLGLKLRDASAVVTVSDYNAAHLARTWPGTRAVRIYNGIDLDRFRWQPPAPDADEILAVGRLVEKKGFHILIEALRILAAQGRPIRCRIVGAGEEEADLRAQIAACGLDGVTLDGPMPQEAIKAAMRKAAMLACPCVVGEDGNRDGMPTVLLEAMALGLPCIGSDVTGIPELIKDSETGLIAPEGDAPALARQIARLLDDPALRAHLSTAARAAIERDYDIRRNVPRLGAIFDACAVGEAKRGAA